VEVRWSAAFLTVDPELLSGHSIDAKGGDGRVRCRWRTRPPRSFHSALPCGEWPAFTW